MQPYENRAGNSGVSAFQIVANGIWVRFVGGATYFYDHRTSGRAHVDEMKQRARAGRGLSRYIAQSGVRYADKQDSPD